MGKKKKLQQCFSLSVLLKHFFSPQMNEMPGRTFLNFNSRIDELNYGVQKRRLTDFEDVKLTNVRLRKLGLLYFSISKLEA